MSSPTTEITVRWDAQTQTFLAKTEHGDYRCFGQGLQEREALESLVSALTLTVVIIRADLAHLRGERDGLEGAYTLAARENGELKQEQAEARAAIRTLIEWVRSAQVMLPIHVLDNYRMYMQAHAPAIARAQGQGKGEGK